LLACAVAGVANVFARITIKEISKVIFLAFMIFSFEFEVKTAYRLTLEYDPLSNLPGDGMVVQRTKAILRQFQQLP
jgi:hypothetical protein